MDFVDGYVVMVSLQGSFIAYFLIIAAFGLLGTWAGSGTNLPLSRRRMGTIVASGKRRLGGKTHFLVIITAYSVEKIPT